ncbi:MAG: FHA domain-containing protein [Phycisphaerales bacterium]|nr:FHA domain-containing protein [Phycisphaerales bacterium]
MRIGREDGNQIRIPLAAVSREHAEIESTGKVAHLRDLGSSNGTFVNGQKISDRELHPGDRVVIGSAMFVVRIDGVPEDLTHLLEGGAGDPSASASASGIGAGSLLDDDASAGGSSVDGFDIDDLLNDDGPKL